MACRDAPVACATGALSPLARLPVWCLTRESVAMLARRQRSPATTDSDGASRAKTVGVAIGSALARPCPRLAPAYGVCYRQGFHWPAGRNRGSLCASLAWHSGNGWWDVDECMWRWFDDSIRIGKAVVGCEVRVMSKADQPDASFVNPGGKTPIRSSLVSPDARSLRSRSTVSISVWRRPLRVAPGQRRWTKVVLSRTG